MLSADRIAPLLVHGEGLGALKQVSPHPWPPSESLLTSAKLFSTHWPRTVLCPGAAGFPLAGGPRRAEEPGTEHVAPLRAGALRGLEVLSVRSETADHERFRVHSQGSPWKAALAARRPRDGRQDGWTGIQIKT